MMIEHKLASDRAITGLLPALVTLVSIAFVWVLFGREAAFRWTFLAFCAFTALAAVAWWRTRSKGYLASTLYLLAASLMIAVRVGVIPGDREIAPAFGILLFASIVFLVFMLLTRQTKWRGRDILELAALPVEDRVDSFSGRPRPSGQGDFDRADVLDFAAFARRRQLAMTYPEPGRVVFVPLRMGKEFGHLFKRNPGYEEDTWVAFGDDGNVTVNISQEDYIEYREDLDFDQLCQSLADVFLTFFELHRKGQDARILDRLDAMGVGLFS
jgi:hypothetical protein